MSRIPSRHLLALWVLCALAALCIVFAFGASANCCKTKTGACFTTTSPCYWGTCPTSSCASPTPTPRPTPGPTPTPQPKVPEYRFTWKGDDGLPCALGFDAAGNALVCGKPARIYWCDWSTPQNCIEVSVRKVGL